MFPPRDSIASAALIAAMLATTIPASAQVTIRKVGSVEIISQPGHPTTMCKPLGSTTVCQPIGSTDPEPKDQK